MRMITSRIEWRTDAVFDGALRNRTHAMALRTIDQ
jgi:hypothetical protein